MTETTTKRLPKAERRTQLLATAQQIVREEGTDALTLGHLAERAGVSKPITYGHFQTRSGLLVALARELDDRHIEALHEALKRTRPRLPEVARVISSAYMHCYVTVGPEWLAILAALQGDSESEAVAQELQDRYVTIYRTALAPFSALPPRELQRRCVAIIGAAEALGRELFRGRLDEPAAAATLASLIVAWLS